MHAKIPPRAEIPFWRWTTIALLIAGLPYLLAWLATPAGTVFHGGLINVDDLSVYLSAMRQGGEGAWLFKVAFTPEDINPKLTYPFYLLLGRLGNWLGLSHLFTFHAARLACGLLALWLIVRLLERMELGAAVRDAYLWILFASGLGWIMILIGWGSPDLRANWTFFLSLFHAPHFVLGIAAETVIMIGLLATTRARDAGERLKATAIILAGALAVGLLYPYRILPVCALVGGYALVEMWRNSRFAWTLVAPTALAAAILLPLAAYYALVARADPYWEATHVTQNVIPSPSPLALLLGFGVAGLLSLAAVVKMFRQPGQTPPGVRLALIWLGVNVGFLYIPVSFQGRFALGMFIPVSILAAWAIHEMILPRLQGPTPANWRRIIPDLSGTARRVLFILTLPTLFTAVGWPLYGLYALPELYYLPQAEVEAAEWLANHSGSEAIVLVAYPMGNYLPRLIQGRVFVGQPYVTVDPVEKQRQVNMFFDPATEDEWRREFLVRWEITHVYYGLVEQGLGPPPAGLGLQVLYQREGIIIYEVR
jgi:hypothetical protein